ncbi:MAG: hypothetical protein Q7U04_07800 [Bacteriovorax sp.]|nr:hypothetical protein [Bacteriovorax sp.]
MWKKWILQILFILLQFAGPRAFADNPIQTVKSKLQAELVGPYLKKLESKFGDCGSGPQSCLRQVDDYMTANLPKKEICFPYTMCGFYHCMESNYRCSEVGVNYFTQLAFPTCSAYERNIQKGEFSDIGIEWIYTVMVCLQKGLVDECLLKGNCKISDNQVEQKKTCDHITDFTLSYHPGCYIKSGVGVCKLPLKDKFSIWKTVNPYMTAREKQEAYKVIFECLIPKN